MTSENGDEEIVIKTERTKIAAKIIKSCIIQKTAGMNIKLRFLIFGPGQGSAEYNTHRIPVKLMIEQDLRQIADFPENNIKTSTTLNVTVQEYLMMRDYDFTIILLLSIGSISEYSMYFSKEDVAPKIRLYVLKKYAASKSFLMKGPVRAFNRVYRQVYTFTNPAQLLSKISNLVIDILNYKMLVRSGLS